MNVSEDLDRRFRERAAADGTLDVVYDFVGVAGNQPLAAAYTLWPLLIIVGYLLAMRRVGAFDSM